MIAIRMDGFYNEYMEHVESLNPTRIEWCCNDYGITLDELALETGIPYITLIHALNEEAGLTFNQISKIASFFGKGILFFLEKGSVNPETIHTPQFRTLANQKPHLTGKLKQFIERVEKQREIYIGLREELGNLETTIFRHPDLQGKNAEAAAAYAREWLNLGEKNDFNTYRKAVESKGILVFITNGYKGKWQISKESPIWGFTIYDNNYPVIVIKKQERDTIQSFTLMHELGHLLLHKESSIDDEEDLNSYHGSEREANAFAGNLLLPLKFITKISSKNQPDEVYQYGAWLGSFAKEWGVSIEVILRRLRDTNRLEASQYTSYREWYRNSSKKPKVGGNRSNRHKEPITLFGETYVKTVLDALNNQHISLVRASTYLDSLKIKDLHKLEKNYQLHDNI